MASKPAHLTCLGTENISRLNSADEHEGGIPFRMAAVVVVSIK